jgi:hypothetical protein
MKKIFIVIQVLAFIGFAGNKSIGQIEIIPMPEVTPEELVEKIVGEGIQFSNVQYTGAYQASGIFTNGLSTNLGMESGIILTSGAVWVIPGPNYSSSAGVNNGMPGDQLLTSLTTDYTYDASILEFDIIPDSDPLKIKCVFGGEEYNEWVGNSYNDVLGIFVSGLNPTGGIYDNVNIAIVPGTENTPINVNSINNGYASPGVIPDGPCMNCEYYADNTGGLMLEYDGLTTVLTDWLPVVPCEEYHIKIGIADCHDGIYDAGVFIEENSFSSSAEIDVTTILDPAGLTDNMVEGHVEADLIFKLQSAEYAPVTICYEITGTAINGVDYEEIDNCLTFEEGEDSVSYHVVPLYDGLIEGEETIELIVENTLGCEVKYDTVELIIEDYVGMVSQTSPNTIICPESETELWVQVYHGFPPYQFYWEPGGMTNDTIAVSPVSTTLYKVTYSDLLNETGEDSILVTVINSNLNNILEFGFTMEHNTFLPFDITGEILQDTVLLFLPEGIPSMYLVSSFSLPNCARAFVNGEEQLSGTSIQDFTNPVIYSVMAANGELHEWLVVVEIETGITKAVTDGLNLFPNPSNGKFYLETNTSGNDPIELQVMDLTGRIVYERKQAIRETIEIDLSNQPKGMYFLQFKFGEKEINRKVIIQ